MELSETILSMKKLLLSYMKLGSRREVSRSKSNVIALCSRTDMANSQETYAGREVTKSCAVSNFVSADRIQVDRIRLRWNWIEFRSNLVAVRTCVYFIGNHLYITVVVFKMHIVRDIQASLMYCVNRAPGPSLLVESTDSMITPG